MSTFFQDHLGLAVVGAIALVALLVLAAVGLQMQAARLSLRPLVFVGVFFAIVLVPQLLVHGAAALWPKPRPALDAAAMAGTGAFAQPAAVFGPDVDRARLRDARAMYGQALAGTEVAQLWIQDSGETAVAARFADEDRARAGAAALWALFMPKNTSGDDLTTFGTRALVGDTIGLRRTGPAVFLWTGPDRASIEQRIQRTQAVVQPADARPPWIAAFDDGRVAAAAVLLLVVVASLWFLKGAAWAARVEPAAVHALSHAPASAAELEQRLATLHLTRLADGRWQMVAGHELMWESGAYRYVLELDEPGRRVKVLEYLASRETQAGGPQWKRQRGITFFRKELGQDLMQPKAALIRAINEAGWSWQPLLLDAPRGLAWLAG